jgi:hypothetical protein
MRQATSLFVFFFFFFLFSFFCFFFSKTSVHLDVLTEELKEAEYPVGTRDGKRAFDVLA